MAELKNTFSWSFSAAHDFDECRRKRYWSKYGMWGGWDKKASEEQRKAYQFNKMDNIYTLMGAAVEEAIMWAFRQKQKGQEVTAEQVYNVVAKPYMNKAWQESKNKVWMASPKKFCSLREHYYGEWDAATEKERTTRVVEATKQCIVNFLERVWPRLKDVKRAQELPIAGSGGGDPESFMLHGVKIYAIPDYVWRDSKHVHIHDWKAGKVRDTHKEQLAIYGLWAVTKHNARPEDILAYVEYLYSGQVAPAQLTAEDLEHIEGRISGSVADMTDYLVGADRERNEPVPKEEWDLAADSSACRRCNFYELCKSELDG